AVAPGAPPDLAVTNRACAGIRFLYPPQDCRVLGVSTPDPAAIPGLLEARPIVQSGAVVRLPPAAHLGRYAYVIAAAPTPSDCALALNVAAELVDLRYEPLELA